MKYSEGKKLHIIHLLPNLKVGGMENGVVNILNNSRNEKFRLTLCCLQEEGPLKDRINNKNVEIINLKQKPGKRYFLIPKLAMLFKKLRVDIVHTHNFYTGAYGIPAGRLARVPIIIHGEHGGFQKVNFRKPTLTKYLFNLCDAILTVSLSIKDEIIENIPSLKDKIHTIINGVDTKSFYKKSQNKDKKKEEIVIGTIGRLTPEKDYGTLLEAFENVQRELPNIKLKIVGSGNLEYELKGLALKLQINEKVEFLGQRNDIPKILQTFDIFILSSIQEGCSNVILEAFATGLPVIATNVGDNHILLADNRGLLVEPNSQALANSIKTLISDKEKSSKYANAAYDWVTKKRTMKNMVTDYEDIYTKLYFQKMK